MASLVDNCVFTAASGGTGAFGMSAAVTGYQTPAAAGVVDTTKTYRYRAQSSDLSEWEEGSTVASSTATSFTRVVIASSAGGTTTVNFTSPPTVAITMLARDVLQFDDSMSLTAAQKAQARANLGVLKRNYIVNGGMQISQERGTTATTVTASYPVDQFIMHYSNTGTQTTQQVASVTPGGSPNRLRITATAADASVLSTDFLLLRHYIEGSRAADLRSGSASAKTITIQFGVKAPAGTYGVALRPSGTARSYVTEYTISAPEANTDVVKSVTIALDQSGTWLVDNGIGIEVDWWLMAGTSFHSTINTWSATGSLFATANQFNFMGTIGNVFELFDVGLYEGSTAPAFELPDYAAELARCQRYWESTYDIGVVPGTATLTGLDQIAIGHTANFSTQQAAKGYQYKVTKRTNPTVTAYSPATGASGNGHDFQASVDRAATIASIGTNGLRWLLAPNAAALVVSLAIHLKVDARL